MRRTYGDDHVKTLTTQRLIGNNLTDLGNYEEAERVLLECAETQRRVLGPDHPRLQETLYDLALLYKHSERYPEARRYYRDALRIVLKVRGEDHPIAFACLNGVGETFLKEERYDEAEATLSEAMTSGREALGEHSVVGVAASRLARVRKAQGRLEKAEELLTEALKIFRSTMGETNDWTLDTLVELKAAHEKDDGFAMGVNVFKEGVIDMLEQGVVEPMVLIFLSSARTSSPPMSGRCLSTRTRSGSTFRATSSPCLPV